MAAAVFCLVFTFTGIASFYGGAGFDSSVTQHFSPLAGFTSHIVMSGAITLFLVATTAVSLPTRFLSRRTEWASGILALFFLLEAAGAPLLFLLPQALFLVWVVTTSLEVSANRQAQVA